MFDLHVTKREAACRHNHSAACSGTSSKGTLQRCAAVWATRHGAIVGNVTCHASSSGCCNHSMPNQAHGHYSQCKLVVTSHRNMVYTVVGERQLWQKDLSLSPGDVTVRLFSLYAAGMHWSKPAGEKTAEVVVAAKVLTINCATVRPDCDRMTREEGVRSPLLLSTASMYCRRA